MLNREKNTNLLYLKKLHQSLGSYREFYKIEIEGSIKLSEDEFYCALSWFKYFTHHLDNMVEFIPLHIQLPHISKLIIIDFGLSHILHAENNSFKEKNFIIYIKSTN